MTENTNRCSRRDFLAATGAAGVSLAALCAADALGASAARADEPAEGKSVSDTIYIVDQLHCKPGDGRAVYDLYMAEYVPDALERGMVLVAKNVQPPIWLSDDTASNTLEFVWSVKGMMGWAGMVGVSRYSPDVAPKLIEFWRGMDERLESRTRTFSAPDTDVESLTTLARLGV